MNGSRILVAIVGGGLGGMVLMNNLMQYAHIDAHIYEAKGALEERGASVGLNPNALRALDLLGVRDALKRAGAVVADGARLVVGQGVDLGQTVFTMDGGLESVHRAALLRALTDRIPADRINLGKKLTSITDDQTLAFEDGSTVRPDVLVGADGIHSLVRRFVVGGRSDPVNSGFLDCRCVLPLEAVVAKLGVDFVKPDQPVQTTFCGDNGILFIDFIDDMQMVCIASAMKNPPDGWDNAKWTQTVTRQWLLEYFKSWPAYAGKMLELLCGDQEEVRAFVEWESCDTTHIHNGPACVMGDAASAATPYQGAGLGQAIEDALLIGTALGGSRSIPDVVAGFEAYDEIKRPRGRQVRESSRWVGLLCMGEEGLNAEEMREKLKSAWVFIHDWDTQAAMTAVANAVSATRTEGE